MDSILQAQMICPKCNWKGMVYDCEPDVDGDGSLGCPTCGAIVIESDETKRKIGYYRQIHHLNQDYSRRFSEIIRSTNDEATKSQQVDDLNKWQDEKIAKLQQSLRDATDLSSDQ